MNGRRYSDSSPPAGGTQAPSTAISCRSDSMNSSSGNSGIASRRAEDRSRAALASGRNDTTDPSVQR
ncbi:hypothetical protein C1Y40_05569 [Mycobacterium talmoniae]|uniref:Uncharacterized protein n=1 Tax=Mycobacterium talmoniae TaxID=1858794 RepID=A0A2S8BC91_9MYCO|nr:hypothetical protein C1Y40_05569 [Mycobacterium talmoniae]